jgi:hypothetical protein
MQVAQNFRTSAVSQTRTPLPSTSEDPVSDLREQFMSGLGDAWAGFAAFLPKLIGFLLVLVIGYVVAKAVARIIVRVLDRLGFERAVEKGGIARVLSRTQFTATGILGKLIFYMAMLFVLQLAFGMLGPNPVSDMIQGIVAYLPNVLAAIILIVVGAAIATAVKEIVGAALSGLSYGRTLATFAGATVLVIVTFAALDQLRLAPTIVSGLFYALLAVIVGSAIVAVGGGGIPVAREYLDRWANRASGAVTQGAEATTSPEPGTTPGSTTYESSPSNGR